jgi:glycyl-tRNA synthetase
MNIKQEWWKTMTYREDIEGIDAAILMHPKVWEASGHVENFTDPMVDCRSCKSRFRTDVLAETVSLKKKQKVLNSLENKIKNNPEQLQKFEKIFDRRNETEEYMESAFNAFLEDPEFGKMLLNELTCPQCGNKETFTSARQFNLMFKTFIGPVEDSSAVVYLRPETAQGIYVNFLNVQGSARQKLPFGIAQIGKAFRNEINTKNFLFRTREFEQMEMQYFVNPAEDKKWYDYWKNQRIEWFASLGMNRDKLRFHDHPPNKLAHYAKEAADIEYEFPFGWGEIEGIHNRTDFDLSRHEQFSGKSLKYYDEESKTKITPYIIETSAGASRSFMAFLVDAYNEEKVKDETRVVLKFHPKLSPIKAAVLPLVNKDGMDIIAIKIEEELRKKLKVFYDDKGAIGRRYRRQDEAGTPFCITVDTQTLSDKTVTVRERDSMNQDRISIDRISEYLYNKIYL